MKNYTRLAVGLIVVSAVFPLLAFITLLLRVRSRKIARKRLDASDYFLFVTMVRALATCLWLTSMYWFVHLKFIALGNAILCIVGATDAGLGEQSQALTPDTEVAFMKVRLYSSRSYGLEDWKYWPNLHSRFFSLANFSIYSLSSPSKSPLSSSINQSFPIPDSGKPPTDWSSC